MSIGEKIRKLRTEKGMSQADLAAILGRNQRAISAWERGASNAPMPTLVKMCRLFGISLAHFDEDILPAEAEPAETQSKEAV